MRLRYVAVVLAISAVIFPWLGWKTAGVSPLVLGLSTKLLGQSPAIGVAIDPIILAVGLVLGAYWYLGKTEYQLRHQLYEDIVLVPLKDTGDRHNDPAGSRRAVQFEMDRSVLVLGETGSGKTEAIKVLAHQLQAAPNEPFVVFDYKQDYQTFFPPLNVIRLSLSESDVRWNVFMEIEDESDYDEIAEAVFADIETDSDYFANAATHVFADVLRLLQMKYSPDYPPTNAELLRFLDYADVELLHAKFTEENLSAQEHIPVEEEASDDIVSILEERVKAVFSGDFAERGDFSVREYMQNPEGRILVLDFPIQQSSSVHPIFRLLIDWSIQCGLDDERRSYYVLDEFAALPRLDRLGQLLNAGRVHNCYSILGVQAIPQLRATYADETDSLLSALDQEIHLRIGHGSVGYCRKRLENSQVELPSDDDEKGDDKHDFEKDWAVKRILSDLDAGRGVVYTMTGHQWGRLHTPDEIEGKLLTGLHWTLQPNRGPSIDWSKVTTNTTEEQTDADVTDSVSELEEEN